MKKIFTLFTLMLLSAASASAQSYNLFPASDVDENGWLWFDTQEKIDKYVGVCDEDNYTVDPKGKPIQMVFANITPDYPETYADPSVIGVDKAGNYLDDEGYTSGESLTGAIVLAKASGLMGNTNGGCLLLNLPSCSSISIYLASEGYTLMRSLKLTAGVGIDVDDSTGENPWTGSTKYIYGGTTMFKSFSDAGHFKWETAATDNNGYNEGENFVSDGPVYFCLQNCRNRVVFIHGIKVTVPNQSDVISDGEEETGVKSVTSIDDKGAAQIYGLDGKFVGPRYAKNNLAKGVYVVKQGDKARKVIVK